MLTTPWPGYLYYMVWFTATAIVSITVILIIWTHKRSTIPTHAGGIVYKVDNGRKLFLMVTSSVNRHKWVLPKGRIEAYETPQVTAAREVMEEAGVTAAITKLAGTVSYSKRGKKITVAYFVMEFNKQAEKSNEGRQVCWVEKQDVIKRLVNKDTAALMRKI